MAPSGFEAYARVLHPVKAQLLAWEGDTPITGESARLRWCDITARAGEIPAGASLTSDPDTINA